MGGFYATYFTTPSIVFNGWLKSRAIGQMALLFSFSRNTPTSFFNNLAKFFMASPALGIHLKPQSV